MIFEENGYVVKNLFEKLNKNKTAKVMVEVGPIIIRTQNMKT